MAASSKGALGMLNVYDSSDSDREEDVPGPKVATKRSASKEYFQRSAKRKTEDYNTTRLPLPSALKTLFPAVDGTTLDGTPEENPAHHDGRVRSFPHERGNWSTFVYIQYEPQLVFQSLVDVIVECLREIVPVKPIKDLHISLTRTVVLRHHWIDSFVDSLQLHVKELPRFRLSFGSVKVYCNEEKTRTFIGLAVLVGREELVKSVQVLDKCLAEFKLPPFYEDPSFHLSAAWCLGDHTQQVNLALPQLELAFQQFVHAHPDKWSFPVHNFLCKTGNKLFAFHLAT